MVYKVNCEVKNKNNIMYVDVNRSIINNYEKEIFENTKIWIQTKIKLPIKQRNNMKFKWLLKTLCAIFF